MAEFTRDRLADPSPLFLNRIGGSDTNAVAALLEARAAGLPDDCTEVMSHLPVVQRYNGYYDLTNNPTNYIGYLEILLDLYERSRYLFFCNFQLLSMYFPENTNPEFVKPDFPGKRGFELLIDRIEAAQTCEAAFPYQFIEKLASHPFTMMNVLSGVLPGKRVLVVSPFSESIEANFPNRHKFFKNYIYPDFNLELCNTPITYSGLPPDFYPHQNWFRTTMHLQEKIALMDFDIALLSCGSYAGPIGYFIEKKLKRQALYFGGVLQFFFGITGRRYADNEFFLEQINPEYFIYPTEGKKYLQHIAITPQMAREAFAAYF
jgi:hypothetical protein